ncbi:hypothetical protein [Subtercola lobariae]|uniref:DUF308 domain-containing protein n=1 Tax=Subtercola lobariae TaxID=1588641 RepID=A0A917BCG5_9MICO|nr:hypothetical protein [Subtercola lobariae]GGF37091.1 hypothetical protein GCM10011399_32530 [Subtercola lobariae]
MSVEQGPGEGRSPYWGVPIARAIPAFVVAAYLTFTENHSSQVGLFVFGSYAVVASVIVAVLSARYVAVPATRRLCVAQGVIGLVLGVVALVFNTGGTPFFLYIVTLFGALTGFLELYCGLRSRTTKDHLAAKDWIAAGAFTALLALVFLVVPLDVVTAVGLFGGYAVMLGIYLVIGGLSLRWGPGPAASTSLSQETTL